ncbi:MAG: tetratricopeptide repeat protein, partial [Planctomycetales bacterium]|nr:tetratricopeptide repeat protein [Planctomycetales bacterium]
MKAPLQKAIKEHQDGNLDAAEKLYQQILAGDPGQATALHYLGVIDLQRGQFSSARQRIEASLKRDPNDMAAWNNLANVMYALGHWTESLRCAAEVLDRDAANAVALNHQGNALLRLREDQEAVTAFRAAVAAQPRYAEAWSNLGHALLVTGTTVDGGEAEACCRRAIELSPGLAAAHNHLGLALNQQQRAVEALASFQQAAKLAPHMPQVVANCAVATAEGGDSQAALAFLESLPPEKQDQAEVQRAWGHILQRVDEPEAAIRRLLRAVELRPDSVESLVSLGVALRQQGRFDDAVDVLQRAATRCPHDMSILNSLANVLRDKGDLLGARELCDVALQVDPTHSLLRLNRASLCERSGDIDTARQDLAYVVDHPTTSLLNPTLLELRLACLYPGAGATAAELRSFRDQLTTVCDKLVTQSRPAAWSLGELRQAAVPPLGLLYDSQDNRKLRERFAEIYRPRLAGPRNELDDRSLKTRAVHHGQTRHAVGFYVGRQQESVFARCMSGIVNRLEQDSWQPLVFGTASTLVKLQHHLDQRRVQFVEVGEDLDHTAMRMRATGVELLYFWEVGTDPHNYLLPFLRVAPIQVTSWGVPDTTGVREVDAYLSSELVETPWGAEASDIDVSLYTERLLLASTLLTFQPKVTRPSSPAQWLDSLNVAATQRLYLCTQKLEKLHPDFDGYLIDILRQDPRGIIAIFA